MLSGIKEFPPVITGTTRLRVKIEKLVVITFYGNTITAFADTNGNIAIMGERAITDSDLWITVTGGYFV